MSKETLQHLNMQTLIGFTAKRGVAWHYRADEQGDEPNHYTGAIPTADVQRRLFHWTAESRALAVELPATIDSWTHVGDDGSLRRWAPVTDRQAICRSDDAHGNVMGIFGPGYVRHQYQDWLVNTVADILDDDLAISSAGLLRGGAVAWVEISVPENITTPEGVEFRANLLATTSFDGSISTTFKRAVTDVVCDNTRALALAERGQEYKMKHTRRSHARLAPAREALPVVHTLADDFAGEVAKLCATQVTTKHWQHFLDRHVPAVNKLSGEPLNGRAKTLADNKREALERLYTRDSRVAPWAGTAHGVLQAVNTCD